MSPVLNGGIEDLHHDRCSNLYSAEFAQPVVTIRDILKKQDIAKKQERGWTVVKPNYEDTLWRYLIIPPVPTGYEYDIRDPRRRRINLRVITTSDNHGFAGVKSSAPGTDCSHHLQQLSTAIIYILTLSEALNLLMAVSMHRLDVLSRYRLACTVFIGVLRLLDSDDDARPTPANL
ncbi:hypothetical protein PM082_012138 [Marasmius tenuissimus]|nr:hypothetical protein PM082_012138 [Marasmius tenuissimus]